MKNILTILVGAACVAFVALTYESQLLASITSAGIAVVVFAILRSWYLTNRG